VRRVDTVVIGAGAMGSSTAWWLARRGRSVVLAEQFEQGHVRGSSHGGVRIFRLAYPDAHYVTMCRASLGLWRELEADTGEHLLDLVGAFDHGPAGSVDGIAEALAAAGVRHERLSPAEAAERAPGLAFDHDVVFHPDAGRAFADRTGAALQRRAGELGAEVRFSCPARIVRSGGDGAEIDLGGETVHASTVVVTAGAWVDGVAGRSVGLPPLAVTQEQVVHFRPLDPGAVFPSFIHHVAPWRYGLHTPDEGVKVGGHHEGPATTGDTRTFELDPVQVAAVEAYVRTWVPGVEPVARFGATCLYTTTPTEDFLIDRAGSLVIGSPCSGHGFKFTPLIGRMLADLAADPAAASRIDPRHRLPTTA
jgi:sarcosine oxidase